MTTIEIDFDVFKALTALRATASTTYNDVIRALLKLPPSGDGDPAPQAGTKPTGWTYKGIHFPEGTEFRATYKGEVHSGKVQGGELIVKGEPRNSPSEAAYAITGNSVNGWTFWECRRPGETGWRLIKGLRETS